ncbi:MAG: type II secretion system major pseudopilin GspG [Terrimicrobiaceae bacterium]|nr:type II secretion system major pseudopilin GspG [Terrimicrobiaceae bacterium]
MNSPISRRRRSRAGYTLFEIMLVLGIIAVLVGSAIFMLVGNVDIAKEQRVESDIQAISMQLRTYEMLNYRRPTTEQGLQSLVSPPTSDPKPRRWKQLMKAVPLDPWGNEYVYRNPGKINPDGYDIFSLGPDGKESDDDVGK